MEPVQRFGAPKNYIGKEVCHNPQKIKNFVPTPVDTYNIGDWQRFFYYKMENVR